MKRFIAGCMAIAALALTGCAQPLPVQKDFSAMKSERPASILVLPALNSSLEVDGPFGVVAQATEPLAEAGYYVFPVALVAETFKQNGLSDAGMIHELPIDRLRDIFGADAALYLDVKEYGSSYAVFGSSVTVAIEAKLVSLRSGEVLWDGARMFSEQHGGSGGGLLGAMLAAVISQVANSLSDRSFLVADIASKLLYPPSANGGLLPGPYAPGYEEAMAQP